jgi:hypothetical protein
VALSRMDMFLKSMLRPVSNLCSATADFTGCPDVCVLCVLCIWFQWICQTVQHRLCHIRRWHSIYLWLLGPICLLWV